MRVRFTKRARSNRDAIFRHVSADDLGAAANLVEGEDHFEHLSDLPGLGRAAQSPGRFVLTAPRASDQIFYRVAGGEVRVLTIRHTPRRRPRSFE